MDLIEYLTYNGILVFTIYASINAIFDENIVHNKNIELISYLIYYIFSSFIYLTNGTPILMLFVNISFIFMIQFNYKTLIKDKILLTIYIYLVILIVDLFTALILNTLNKNLSEMYFSFRYLRFYSIILNLVLFIIIIKSLKLFKNMKFRVSIPNNFFFMLLIVPFISIGLLLILLKVLLNYKKELFITIFVLFALNIAIFLTYNYIIEVMMEKEEKNRLEQKYLNYIEQFELIKENFETLNLLKHDVKKYISYINKLILDGNYKEVLKYIDELNNIDVFKNNINIVKTDNVYIDTILNLKLNEARKNNIDVKTDINIPYDINISSVDIVCLLGNLIDNCIEANLKLNEKERYIFLKIKYNNKTLLINLMNKYDNIIVDNDGYILTSKANRDDKYGLGLKIVEKIIEKYDGILEINSHNNIFDLNIVMNLKSM